jgi:hypothetical protein
MTKPCLLSELAQDLEKRFSKSDPTPFRTIHQLPCCKHVNKFTGRMSDSLVPG